MRGSPPFIFYWDGDFIFYDTLETLAFTSTRQDFDDNNNKIVFDRSLNKFVVVTSKASPPAYYIEAISWNHIRCYSIGMANESEVNNLHRSLLYWYNYRSNNQSNLSIQEIIDFMEQSNFITSLKSKPPGSLPTYF